MTVLLGIAALGVVLWLVRKPLVRRLVRARLGPYRVIINPVDASRPERLPHPRSVAVIGAGLAGIAASTTLAARGYAVTLLEANGYIGGKIGSWPVELPSGRTEWVNHGFHAFFRHYYNLNRYLEGLGVRSTFRAISDYRILLPDGAEVSFDGRETTPVLNLLSMAQQGIYRLGEVARAPTRDAMGVFLEYDPESTYSRLDHLSLAEFDRRAQLPPRLKLTFNTFARAFFATETRLSLAELVKGFHAYYLGHDGGLIYDYPTRDYEAALLSPIRAQLKALGVDLRLSRRVQQVSPGLHVDGERFDAVVLATDVVATRAILQRSTELTGVDPRLLSLQPGERYAVLRLWLDRTPREGLPVFVVTERVRLLDSITVTNRAEEESAAWVRDNGGAVVELHCYSVPDEVAEGDIETQLMADLHQFLPELAGATVRHRHLAIRRDFASFPIGRSRERPGTDSGVDGLYCAGDWVHLPFPAMLMEAAFSSGLVAANRILARDGLREAPVESVPLRGLLAGVPQSPARIRLLGKAT